MDTKRLLTIMMIAGAVMLLYSWYSRSGAVANPKGANPLYALPITPAGEQGAGPATVVLGDSTDDDKHGGTKVAITINNKTAGIEKAELNIHDYAQSVKREKPLTLFAAVPDMPLPFSTLGVHVRARSGTVEFPYGLGVTKDSSAGAIAAANGTLVLQTQYLWKVASQDQTHVSLEMNFQLENKPLLKITKTFTIDPVSYDVRISHTIENESDLDLTVSIDQLGPGELPRDDPQGDERVFHAAGLDIAKKAVDPVHAVVSQAELLKIGANEMAKTIYAYRAPDAPPAGAAGIVGEIKKIKDADFTLEAAAGTYDVSLTSATEIYINGARALPADLAAGMKAAVTTESGTRWIGQMNDYGTGKPEWLQNPVLWISSSNRFFTTIVRPLNTTPSTATPPGTFTLSTGKNVFTPAEMASAYIDIVKYSEKLPDLLGMVRLAGAPLDIDKHTSIDEPLAVYMGPKQREVLDGNIAAVATSNDYAHAVYQYTEVIQLSSGGCYKYCTFEFVAIVILKLLDFLAHYVTFNNYGIAIMVLVIVVRAAMHPLTRASQINMAQMGKKMKEVQPQLSAAKKRYADNKTKLNEETMRIYRENKVNPAGGLMGCLPMLIQMPIWAALYSGLRTDIDLRHAAFIPGWINDLASPDSILPIVSRSLSNPLFTLPLLGDIYGLNLLPLLLAVVFFFQMKVNAATQPKAQDEQQAQMQKMSQYMIFLFPLFLYKAPSGLNLYIFASTMGGLLDTWLVRKTLKKRGILPASAQTLPTHEEKE